MIIIMWWVSISFSILILMAMWLHRPEGCFSDFCWKNEWHWTADNPNVRCRNAPEYSKNAEICFTKNPASEE